MRTSELHLVENDVGDRGQAGLGCQAAQQDARGAEQQAGPFVRCRIQTNMVAHNAPRLACTCQLLACQFANESCVSLLGLSLTYR